MPPPSSSRQPIGLASDHPPSSSLLLAQRSRHLAFPTSDFRPLTSVSSLLLFLLLSSFILPPSSFSTPPPWWTTRGVLDPNATPDDYAPVNAGQLKNMAKALYDEIEFRVPGGPSPALYSHMEALAATPDDYVVINIGQIKNVVKPFYDFLAPFGGPAVPWPAPGPTTDDYAPANLGQLKNLFAQLDPASLLAAPAMSDDSDGDGLTNAEEIVVGTDPYTPNTVIHGSGTIVTKGIGVYRAKNGITGFLGQNRYLKEEYTDNLNFDYVDAAGTRTVWTRTETTIKVVNTEGGTDGGVVFSSQHLHQEGYTVVAGVTYPHAVFDSQTTSGTPVLLSRSVGGLTDNIQSDALRTSTTLNGPYSGGSTATFSELFDDSRLNKLILSDLNTHSFPAPGASPASPDWGQHHWYWPPAPYRYYWNDLPCAYGNPLLFYPYSAIRFYYPPQGSGLINSVARNKLQFALKVDNPQPGVVYVKRGVMVWRPQNGLAGNGTVVNTVNLMVKGGAGGPVVYSPAWIMEARGGYGRLDVVDSGAYLNLAGVSESEENNYGAKVIGAGTSVGISFGVGASGAAEAFRVRFHLRQGDPAHAYVRRPAPSTVQVPWDVPFEIDHSSDPNWEFGADAPGVYVIEQVTSVLIGGQDIVVDREYVTVTVVDFTKLQISSADIPPRAIEDTTSPDEPRTAANTLYLCEDPTGFTTLNIQGWWEPESTGNAECKWVIQEINDSSGTPSGRWESGYGTFSANPAVSIFNGNTPGTAREFKVTGWYDCNSNNVLDPGEPLRQVFVNVPKVEFVRDDNNDQAIDEADSVIDHAQAGHWGATSGNGVDGYDAAGNVINNTPPDNFVDKDPERFYLRIHDASKNANSGIKDMITAKLVTLNDAGVVDDNLTEIKLEETGVSTGVFVSKAQMLQSPDLPAADKPDDTYKVNDGFGNTPADDTQGDRTHRATIDGTMRAEYEPVVGVACSKEITVCDRGPEERRILRVNVQVFNEPPGADISGDGAINTVLGTEADATNHVNAQVGRSNIAWAQACVKVELQAIIFINAPNDAGGNNILADGTFSTSDRDVVVNSFSGGASVDVLEVFFVAPIIGGGNAYTIGPVDNIAALGELTFVFINPGLDIRYRTLAHEIGHALDNGYDNNNPMHVFYPALNTYMDNDRNSYRRISEATTTNCRTVRPVGNKNATGNRILSTP